MLKEKFLKLKDSSYATVGEWLEEEVFYNISNPIVVQIRDIEDDEEGFDSRYESRPFIGDFSGKWRDSYTEDLDFENYELLDFNLELNTLTLVAYGDWQNPVKFTITLQEDGSWLYNDDGEVIEEDWVDAPCEERIKNLLNGN